MSVIDFALCLFLVGVFFFLGVGLSRPRTRHVWGEIASSDVANAIRKRGRR